MRALLISLFGAAVATSLFAQSADVEVAISAPSVVHLRETVPWTFTVANRGPDTAHEIEVSGFPCGQKFVLPFLRAGERYQTPCSARTPFSIPPNMEFTFGAGAKSRLTPDPSIENNYRFTVARIATTDLVVRLDAPATVRAGTPLTWSALITNEGPDDARAVIVRTESPGGLCTADIANLRAGETFRLTCTNTPPLPGYSPYVSAWAMTYNSREPNVSNNNPSQVVTIESNPDLLLSVAPEGIIDPDLPFIMKVSYGNWAHATATNVVAVIELADARGFQRVPNFCVVTSPTRVECLLGDVSRTANFYDLEPKSFDLEVIANSDASGSPFPAVIAISANEADQRPEDNQTELGFSRYRTFYVLNREDVGQGSLREAIESATECSSEPCKIAFRIEPSSASRWETIRPYTPLPPISGLTLTIDGSIQSRFFGDRNPDGPEIEIRGDLLKSGDGLELAGSFPITVQGLTINGFPGNAIAIRGSGNELYPGAVPIRDCYIGSDPTGMYAIPNHRGIFADRDSRAAVYVVENNLISGNRRAGIFAGRGIREIRRNRIGINRDSTGPLSNGASGIYIGPASKGTDVIDNTIAFNEHFGIAIDAHLVAIVGNSIHANHQGGIDIGLDGPSEKVRPFPLIDDRFELALPLITHARYDAAENSTIIEGAIDDATFYQMTLTLYANDAPDPSGYGEGQYVLGTATASGQREFTFRYAGDLRGKWVAATATRTIFIGFAKPATDLPWMMSATSEFSRAVLVAP